MASARLLLAEWQNRGPGDKKSRQFPAAMGRSLAILACWGVPTLNWGGLQAASVGGQKMARAARSGLFFVLPCTTFSGIEGPTNQDGYQDPLRGVIHQRPYVH